jgi:hypothetical protein
MNNGEQQNRQNRGGSGSAENMGKDRSAQQADAPGNQPNVRDAKSGSEPVGNIRDTGALSGRDDASGGSGDDMEKTNSNEPTERF